MLDDMVNVNDYLRGKQSPMQSPMPAKRGGLFGGAKFRNIAGAIGDALMQYGGLQPTYGPMMERSRQREAMIAEAEAKRQQVMEGRQYEREDFIFREKFKQGNPSDQLTMYMQRAGIDPGSPEAADMYRRAAMNKVDPIQGVPFTDENGTSGIQFIRPGQVSPQRRLQPGQKYIPEGGPTQPASGNFRY